MTGIELIQQERYEQINKHRWDDSNYQNGELLQAARFAEACTGRGIGCTGMYPKENGDLVCWPEGWSHHFRIKLLNKTKIEALVVAGAFYMAENDRRKDLHHAPEINKIASEIDELLLELQLDADIDFDSDEILGYHCSSCGNIQDKNTGFGCDTCSGKCLNPWFG